MLSQNDPNRGSSLCLDTQNWHGTAPLKPALLRCSVARRDVWHSRLLNVITEYVEHSTVSRTFLVACVQRDHVPILEQVRAVLFAVSVTSHPCCPKYVIQPGAFWKRRLHLDFYHSRVNAQTSFAITRSSSNTLAFADGCRAEFEQKIRSSQTMNRPLARERSPKATVSYLTEPRTVLACGSVVVRQQYHHRKMVPTAKYILRDGSRYVAARLSLMKEATWVWVLSRPEVYRNGSNKCTSGVYSPPI